MTLCELEALGWLGWVDAVFFAFAFFCAGGLAVGWVQRRWHRNDVLGAYWYGRQEGLEGKDSVIHGPG